MIEGEHNSFDKHCARDFYKRLLVEGYFTVKVTEEFSEFQSAVFQEDHEVSSDK